MVADPIGKNGGHIRAWKQKAKTITNTNLQKSVGGSEKENLPKKDQWHN